VHFAPGDEACNNLKRVKGEVINTRQNTLLDSLKFSRTIPIESDKISQIISENYFVFVMHRQENLVSKVFVADVIREIEKAAKERKCVLLLHKITENALIKFELMKELEANDNIIMIPRVEYFDFMKLLEHSQFVITDGGSNQEELFYMRKPCLILRKVTERNEGLGVNARLFDGRAEDINVFVESISNSEIKTVDYKESPSKIIVDYLL
jgi:UDP-N-acetylglucosamine 2-epimerase (non-hydrolysing)